MLQERLPTVKKEPGQWFGAGSGGAQANAEADAGLLEGQKEDRHGWRVPEQVGDRLGTARLKGAAPSS